jgi:hypothetical protein
VTWAPRPDLTSQVTIYGWSTREQSSLGTSQTRSPSLLARNQPVATSRSSSSGSLATTRVGGAVVGSRPWTADERRWNSGRLADGDSPELVIFPRARSGRGREWEPSEPAGIGPSQAARATRLSTLVDSTWLST